MNRSRALGAVLIAVWLWVTIARGIQGEMSAAEVVWIAWSIVVMTVSVRAGGSGGVAARRRGSPPV